MLSVICQHNLAWIHLDFFLIWLLCEKRQNNWNGEKHRRDDVSWELEQDRQSLWGWWLLRESLVIKGLEEWLIPWGLCPLQRDQHSRGRWAQRNLWKCHKGKCRSCPSRGWGDLWESALWRRAGVLGVCEYMGWNFRNQVSCWRLKALVSHKDTRTVAAIKANREQIFLV